MKPKIVILVVASVLLLASVMASAGCGGGGGAVGMMGKLPKATSSFSFSDIKAVRGDSDLDKLYTQWKNGYRDNLNNLGIDINDVNGFGEGGGIQLVDGEFDLQKVRDTLDKANYHKDTYEDVEVWTSNSKWLALLDNLIIIGSQQDVKDCIKVIKGENDSLASNTNAKKVMDKLPGGILIYYEPSGQNPQYKGLDAWGGSIEKIDKNNLKITWVYKFDTEDHANGAVDNIKDNKDNVNSDKDYGNIVVHQDGQFVIATAEIDIDAYTLAAE